MSDDNVRPRRALAPDDSADQPVEPAGLDKNPFARPGSDAAASPAPSPRRSLPSAEPSEPDEEPASRSTWQAPTDNADADTIEVPTVAESPSRESRPVLPGRGEGFYEGPGPKPRRSAMSSITPPEASEWVPETSDSAADTAASDAAAGLTREGVEADGQHHDNARDTHQPWYKAHLPAFVASGVAVVVLAAAAGFLGYAQTKPAAPTTPSASPTVSASPSEGVARVTQDDLLTEADAKAISANADWVITGTTDSLEAHTARPACLSTETSDIDRLTSLQRTFGTTQKNQLALLQQLDAFPTEANAQEVFNVKAQALAQCTEVQTLLLGSKQVSGIGDAAVQISVVEEADPKQYHDLLLTRTGNIVSIVDVATSDGSVDPATLVKASERSATNICTKAGDCKPSEATVKDAQVPPVEPKGWLTASDLPRIRAGAGLWATQQPAAISSKGTGCENMTLASEAGPTQRQQATYLMTQDDKAPAQFGLDEYVFSFADTKAAGNFATKLGNGLSKCKERVLGTKVSPLKVDGATSAYTIERETDKGSILYQVSVVRKDQQVIYLMATVTKDYQFTAPNLSFIAQRAAVRAGQR